MSLTTVQLQALKTYLTSDPDGRGFAAHLAPPGGDGDTGAILSLLNATAPYYVLRTDAPVQDILDNILWANYTPNVTITTAITQQTAAQCAAASGYCDNKQFNLQIMLQGRDTFNATKKSQVNGLKDATTALPTGNNFNAKDAGWTGIIPVLQRQATYAEKLFAVVSTVTALQNVASARGTQYDGTNGNPDVMTVQGALQLSDVQAALAS